MILKICIAMLSALALSGCACMQQQSADRPGLIGHIVFIELQDRADYQEILDDSDSMLSTISGVVSYAAGQHIDTGRESVRRDYDLAIYLGFDSVNDLAGYVASDQHVAFVTKWKPRLGGLRVYDMHDPTR